MAIPSEIADKIEEAQSTLSNLNTSTPETLIEGLRSARDMTQTALDEALALAVLAGESIRTVASYAEMAPNSVPPRLAKTTVLADYAEPDGSRVTAQGIARARYESPLKFIPRKADHD